MGDAKEETARAIEEKLRSDLRYLGKVIKGCQRCGGGGGGIPGAGEPGSDLFMLAGRPGPGATPDNPWGSWRDDLYGRLIGEWGWDQKEIYLSTALRCPLEEVTPANLRRCAGFLAEELFIVGPRLVIVSGKLAAVALRAAFGEAVPGKPRAGDRCRLFWTDFLFNLDIARVGGERKAAETFWNILEQASPT